MGDLHLDFDPPATRCIVCGGALLPWRSKVTHGHRFYYDRCAACAFVFVNPRPTLESLGRFYEGYAGLSGVHEAGALGADAPVAGPPQRKLLKRMLAIRPGPGRFLDVGSGSGIATAAAHDAGLVCTALEVEPAHVEATRRLPGVSVLPVLFEHFDGVAGGFDYVLMSHVLEHVHDPLGFMEKGARLLSRGGLIWVLLPSFDSVYRRLFGTGDPYFIPPGHLNHFNPVSLARLCRRVGLTVVESVDYHDVPRNVVSKRLPRVLAPMVEGMTAAAGAIACWGTGVCGWGAFVSCAARRV